MIPQHSEGDERPLSELRGTLRDDPHRKPNSRSPLIEHVSNRWQENKATYTVDERGVLVYDLEKEEFSTILPRSLRSRRGRRMFMFALLLLGLGLWVWWWYILPQWQDEWEIEQGFLAQSDGGIGVAKGGDFDGLRLQDLEVEYLPGGEQDPNGERRLVFIGDIHGCIDELKALLKDINFNEESDHLITVGDVISKGPDSPGVLDELIRLRASSVRGNHEDRILALAPLVSDIIPSAEIASNGAAKDAKLLKELSKKHLEYLRTMPLILRVPALPLASHPSHKTKSPLAEDILVVHAGLVPGVALEKQDPYFVMNMRSIRTKNHLPLAEAATKKAKSKPWHDIWAWYNDRLFRKKSVKDFGIWESAESDDVPSTEEQDSWFARLLGLKKKKDWPRPEVVVYGHHSREDLQIKRWSKGLDTGCVRGGKLTAMVLDARGDWEIASVGCKDHR